MSCLSAVSQLRPGRPHHGGQLKIIMTIKLIQILTDLSELMGDWNARAVPTEQEFIDQLQPLARGLVAEVAKQELPVIKKEKNG